MRREPKTFKCPKCGDVRVERLANAVGHPCPANNKNTVDYKEVKNSDE